MKVGVLALQGDVPEHRAAIQALVPPEDIVLVRSPGDLDGLDGLLMPGGESTTMARLLQATGLFEPLRERLSAGLPVLGTCAGLILLSKTVVSANGEAAPDTFGILSVIVRRNDYGRQIDSFEGDVMVPLAGARPFPGVFIRAPRILEVSADTEVIARRGLEVVGVRRGAAWGFSFHPELSEDDRVHAAWLANLARSSRQRRTTSSATVATSRAAPASAAHQ